MYAMDPVIHMVGSRRVRSRFEGLGFRIYKMVSVVHLVGSSSNEVEDYDKGHEPAKVSVI